MFDSFTLIAGPCVLEDDGLNLEIAQALRDASRELGIPVVFKASFDKANRSRLDAARGPGLDAGVRALARVRSETGLPVLTDIHAPSHAEVVAEVADALQIPAFLGRQTDLLVAAARTGRPVNLKKGQWMSPAEAGAAVTKLRAAAATQVIVTERGTSFGHGDLVVDMRSFDVIRKLADVPVYFDGTHAVQRPGAEDGATGGTPEHVPALVRAAVAAGCDGLFLETHPDPVRAPSDSASMLPLDRIGSLLAEVVAIRAALSLTSEPADDRPGDVSADARARSATRPAR